MSEPVESDAEVCDNTQARNLQLVAEKLVWSPSEAARLGFGSVRWLSQCVRDRVLVKSVVWLGRGKRRRKFGLLREELAQELRSMRK